MDHLIPHLDSPAPRIFGVFAALFDLATVAEPQLREAVRRGDPLVRPRAALVLCEVGLEAPDLIPELIAALDDPALRNHPAVPIRPRVLAALLRLAEQGPVPQLREMLPRLHERPSIWTRPIGPNRELRRLEQAIAKWEHLPLPITPPAAETAKLPRPTETAPGAESRPLPTDRRLGSWRG